MRRKLGVATIREAVEMSEFAGIQAQIDSLGRKFDDAISALKEATTPKETASAKDTIRDLRDELRLRGLTEKDLDDAAARKRDAVIDDRVAAALKVRDDEAEAKRLADEAAAAADDDDDANMSVMDKIKAGKLDGLGGRKNVQP